MPYMQRGIILNIHFVYEYARKKRARWGAIMTTIGATTDALKD